MKKILYVIMTVAAAFLMFQCAYAKTLTPVSSITSGGHTYTLYDESLTWDEANDYCTQNGGHLVTITSEDEQAAVEILLESGSKKQYWIGLRTNGEPEWVTGENFDYSNWDRGEPNNHSRSDGESENYVHIYNIANPAVSGSERFKWNDMYVDNTYPGEEDNFGADTVGFICETEVSQAVVKNENNDKKASIPDDALQYNGHSYKIYDTEMTWEEAKAYCEDLGGYLAVVTSEDEWNFLHNVIEENKKHCWLGASDADTEGIWQWVNGEEWSYTDWNTGEPNNDYSGTEDYLGTYKGSYQWNDYRNSTELCFVCEWDSVGFAKTTSNWSTSEIQEAYENNLIPEFLVEEDLTQNITRAEFASVSLKLYEALADTTVTSGETLPFKDINGIKNYSDIEKAYMLDIAVGTSPVTFDPNSDINREQLVTMLTRTIKKYKYSDWTIENDDEYILLASAVTKKFADDSDISDFARDSVYFMSEMGIVSGVDATHFAPKNTTDEQTAKGYAAATREQALALSLRIFKKADLL